MPDGVASAAPGGLRTGEPRGRWVLLATVLGSGMAMLDATVVTIALPAIGRDLGSGLSGLQWTLNGYTLTLAAFILVGGSVGDLWGRRRVFVLGTATFALTSALCAVAPSVGVLVGARVLQGVAGALLTPGSLAIISSSFHRDDRAAAIGAWSGLSGVTTAVGPFVGGWLIEHASWRWIFLINLPLAAVVVLVSVRHVPESSDPDAVRQLDLPGALTGVVWLAALTFGLIRWGAQGLDGAVVASLVVTAVALAGFVRRRAAGAPADDAAQPSSPLGASAPPTPSPSSCTARCRPCCSCWRCSCRSSAVSRRSPPGAAFLPVTFLMLLGSAQVGRWSERWGPRPFMTVGPLVGSVAMVLLAHLVTVGASYWRDVLPPVVVFGVGLTLTVAPLTTTVLAAAPARHAGLASGVNNAVARSAGLLAVAVLPLAAGLAERTFRDVRAFDHGFDRAMVWCAVLLSLGGLLSAALIGPRAQVARGGTPSPT